MMRFDLAWTTLGELVRGKYDDIVDDAELPAPAEMGAVILDAHRDPIKGRRLQSWMAETIDLYRERVCALVDLYVGTDSSTAGLLLNGFPYGIPIPAAAGADDSDGDRLTDGFLLLHLVLGGAELTGAGDDGPDGAAADSLVAGLEAVHVLWSLFDNENLPHPLAALILGWMRDRPEPVIPDDRTRGILPQGLLSGPPATIPAVPRSNHSTELPVLGRVDPPTDQLPLLAELMDNGALDVPLLQLADRAGFRGLQPGRGARLDKRLLLFSLLAVPIAQRRPGGRTEWTPSLRQLRDLLWPVRDRVEGGVTRAVSTYRPNKHGRALLRGLDALSSLNVILPDGRTWRPIHVWENPNLSNLDGRVYIEIRFPADSDHGPLIDKPALIGAGTISDPAFDLEVGLAYLWDEAKRRGGGRRVYATRPAVRRNAQNHLIDASGQVILHRRRPATRWDHQRAVRTGRLERNPAADRVRVLDRAGRRRLAYGPEVSLYIDTPPKSKAQIRNEETNADRLLADLEKAGRIVIERGAVDVRTGVRGWRILEEWPGQ